jgi:hypothetical protein
LSSTVADSDPAEWERLIRVNMYGFARGVAREVGRYAITVSNVALGSMKTPARPLP